jgi:hypothetical protein
MLCSYLYMCASVCVSWLCTMRTFGQIIKGGASFFRPVITIIFFSFYIFSYFCSFSPNCHRSNSFYITQSGLPINSQTAVDGVCAISLYSLISYSLLPIECPGRDVAVCLLNAVPSPDRWKTKESNSIILSIAYMHIVYCTRVEQRQAK